jgi:hypothetical protein
MDKITTLLIDALKRSMDEPEEVRLFRSGKLPGLFATKTGNNLTAANIAVRDGLLEVVRSETKGKTQMDWVRPTPRAVDFIHQQESPVVALRDLRGILRTTQQGIPVWLDEIRQQIEELSSSLGSEVQAIARRLEVLSLRVHEAIERAEASQPEFSEEMTHRVPWARDVLDYLDRRTDTGVDTPCSLAELYQFLRQTQFDLTMSEFHQGLRRLTDRGVLRLLPHIGTNGFPQPEFALLEGDVAFFYVARTLW